MDFKMIDGSIVAELEKMFRSICLEIKSNPISYDSSLIQWYQDCLSNDHQNPSLYNITRRKGKKYLFIFDTENESQEEIVLDTSAPLNWSTCIAQLPNGKLLCLSSLSMAYLIDINCKIKALPSFKNYEFSSVIYFNKNVYCFGGRDSTRKYVAQAVRFDLEFNQWRTLTPLPWADYNCNSIMLNRDILISGNLASNLLLYSIDLNSYSTISYEFRPKLTKILINAGERLYLIECELFWKCESEIYESEVANYTVWSPIAGTTIEHKLVISDWTYNKGAIYIGLTSSNYNAPKYYKFNLQEKSLAEVYQL